MGRLLILIFALLGAAPSFAEEPQEIWFGPRSPTRHPTVDDWKELFQPDAPWKIAAAHTQVFFMPIPCIMSAPDADVIATVADLSRRHIAIGLPLMSIARDRGTKMGGVEGYDYTENVTRVAQRLKQLGITPKYLRIDSPLWFGHYDKQALACQYPVDELVKRVAQNVGEYTKVFPDIIVGDVEPVPPLLLASDWRETYRSFKEKLEATIGKKIAFLHLDEAWRNPDVLTDMKIVADFAHSLGMKTGFIYDDGAEIPATTNEEWIADVEKNVIRTESQAGLIPDQAVFQSWENLPTCVMPETSPSAHTYLIDQYLIPRSRIMANRAPGKVTGQLIDAHDHGVASASITWETPDFDPTRPLPVSTVSGTVPVKAASAILAVRLNRECNSSGRNDVLIGPLTYRETESGSVTQTIDYPAQAPSAKGSEVRLTVEQVGGQQAAHIVADPGQSMGFNSAPFAVTPNAHFEFHAPVDTVSGEGIFGFVAVIWMNADHRGIGRVNLPVVRKYSVGGALTTDQNGHFSIPLPEDKAGKSVRLTFSGRAQLRPAIALVP